MIQKSGSVVKILRFEAKHSYFKSVIFTIVQTIEKIYVKYMSNICTTPIYDVFTLQ